MYVKCLRLPQRLRSRGAIAVSKLKSRSQHTESTEEIGARIASISRRSQTESAWSCRGVVQDRRQETFVLPLATLTARSLLQRPPGRPIRHICLTALPDFAPSQILFSTAPHMHEGTATYLRAEKSSVACPLVYFYAQHDLPLSSIDNLQAVSGSLEKSTPSCLANYILWPP
jgi:hypothetical protein